VARSATNTAGFLRKGVCSAPTLLQIILAGLLNSCRFQTADFGGIPTLSTIVIDIELFAKCFIVSGIGHLPIEKHSI